MDLHRRSIVIDLHADTANLMRWGYDIFRRHRPPLPRAALAFHVDVPRMEEGGLTAQLFAVGGTALVGTTRIDTVCREMDLIIDAAKRRPGRLRFVTNADEIEQAKKDGVPAALLGLEGVDALRGDMTNFERLATLGLRTLGISHFAANEAGFPAEGKGSSRTKGLTDFGRTLIEACNEKGILLDLAHLNRPGFMEACRLSSAPVLVSHTGLSGLRPLWRNIDDEQIKAVADTGGCVGIAFFGWFLGKGTIGAVVDHIQHCLKVGGEDCPALGSDFDGLIIPPRGLRDVAALPRLTQALLDRGLEEPVIRKILGGNVLRALRSAIISA
jgi:membrane dipeptidase